MPFGVEEMFFSKTDERGVIEDFNSVFVRISGFSGDELHGAPHKILRHPDMPKAVFWLLWNGLRNGQAVGAYVKNKTKDGKYYWVFALAAPVTGGYFSVRIKPTSDMHSQVVALYKEIRAAELAEKVSAEDSAKRLLHRLQDLGFPNYGWFQSAAYSLEFAARRRALKAPTMMDVTNTEMASELTQELQKELRALASEFDNAEILTANMKIFAAKLHGGRATINEIAKNYDLMLRDIKSHLKSLVMPLKVGGIWETPGGKRAAFMLCGYHLLDEVVADYEGDAMQEAGAADTTHIQALRAGYKLQSDRAVNDCVRSALTIQRRIEFLLRMVLGLSTIRIACRVEAGTLRQSAQGLDTIVGRLDEFQDKIEERMVKIQELATSIVNCIGKS
ncbi:MAG: PAS domain-containing protein [Thalassovita sp.]|nr:PAS domain-containing protein [Thalassovita sp.]